MIDVIPSLGVHTPVGSRDASQPPKRFFSTEPSMPSNRMRQPVNPAGHEALAGFALPPRPAKLAAPRIRSITELTFPKPKASIAAAAPALAVTQTVVPDTTAYPFCANCSLHIKIPGSTETFIATGWFAGPYAVITAAHAVFPREPGGYVGWAASIDVVPGQDGDGTRPNGFSTSSTFFCPIGWQQTGDEHLDYGVVLLPDGLGSQVGAYGFSTYADADLLSSVANLGGYPVIPQPPGKQWYGANNMMQVDASFVYYEVGASGGESGAGVYRNIGSLPYVMAIHTASSGNENRAVRIIQPVYQNIQSWAGMHG